MRVVVVHNRYSSRVPSGENLAVDDEVTWLRDAGVDVVRHEVSNDQMIAPGPLGRARDGLEATWSLSARRRFLADLDAHRPDLVHVHNLFPLLTGSVPVAARRRRIPVVWTVHNHRIRCVAGGNFRDGAPCHECRPGWRAPGIVHRCYAGSFAASGLTTAASSLFRTSARRHGVTPIAISEDVARWLRHEGGFEDAPVQVKYNGVAGPAAPATRPIDHRSFLFLGRLGAYKGVGLLLDAWRRADVDATLRIVGDGDMAATVREAAADDPRIIWDGQVPPSDIGRFIDASRVVVVPSTWHEPFGRTAAEALAYGRPVITTGRGGLSEIVDGSTGWVTGLDPDTMATAFVEAAGSPDAVQRRGEAASARHQRTFSPAATTEALLQIYEHARRHTSGRQVGDDTGRSGHRPG